MKQRIAKWIGYVIFAIFIAGLVYTDTTTTTLGDGYIISTDR